jgi:outer membrane protein assembly factor BamB
MKPTASRALLALICLAAGTISIAADDWPDWRGPARDGVSKETGLPDRWSPAGDNLAWKAPYGGRSAPVVFRGRVFLLNGAGQGDTLQERVVCLDADTGTLVWEHKFNVFLSDVPAHRIGWSSPVVDVSTGNVFAFGVAGMLVALSRDGKLLWERSINEDFGLVTTHGGRTVSPIVDGDLIILSGLNSGWGDQARGSNRYFAFDKNNGDPVWVSNPQARHYDTGYSSPIVMDVNGRRLIVVGGTDGAIHGLKAQTGEPVWRYEFTKRAVNTNVVARGTLAYATHSEENLDTSEMGRTSAIDATASGAVTDAQLKWSTTGFQGGYSSPVLDADHLYQVDNGAILGAFSLENGRKLWSRHLGTIQKGSPVLADGKLYVGTENGKFYILKPGPSEAQVLDEDVLGSAAEPEPIIASPAVANGRVYVVSMSAIYAIGKKGVAPAPSAAPNVAGAKAASAGPVGNGAPTHLQIVPAETIVAPGGRARFKLRLFDADGRLTTDQPATWTLDQLEGSVTAGEFQPDADTGAQAGLVKATAAGVTGTARVRVIPPLPWTETFDNAPAAKAPAADSAPPKHWINAAGKFAVKDLDGNRVLVKLADNPFTKRARVYMGPSTLSDYTVEADVRATEKRRQMGDAGLIAQRYTLVLFGNSQRMELQPWQPNTARTVSAPFEWKADTWYRVKLRVENLQDGTARVRGKAWPAADAEPDAWTVEKVDRIPHRMGTPGLYADAPYEIFFDNLKVTSN